ncbi:Molybdopterin synthase catalytic subunit [Halotydeus destructor]|nr:Molybdopterin synthase catalytic subunit [Halotydeus destructor]
MTTGEFMQISITSDNLNSTDAISFVTSSNCGAISVFLGTTRGYEKDSETGERYSIDSLYYEAYEGMAISLMKQICTAVMKDHDIERCYLAHRKGLVQVAEPSILIACSSAHRKEAHSATMDILDQVKAKVPIWKKSCSKVTDKWVDKSEAFWLKPDK